MLLYSYGVVIPLLVLLSMAVQLLCLRPSVGVVETLVPLSPDHASNCVLLLLTLLRLCIVSRDADIEGTY